MPRYTSAYSSFVRRLAEVDTLRRFALEKERHDPVGLRDDINALCRGSIVLLSGHLEAFIKELGELALDSMHVKAVPRQNITPRLYYHISKNLLDELQGTTHPDSIAEKIFVFLQTDLSYWSRTGPFPQPIPADRFNKGFSNPAFKKIKAYFNRFGYTDYARDLARKLAAQYQPTINMVDHLVDTRNLIAHGDPTATKTPREVKDIIEIIRKYCAETDSAFASWWKTSYCTIR
jgi:hypothetical protein